MGRRPTWTEPELLGAVMALFRRKGFVDTSVRDLEEATGLHPGSLYRAYGSKEALFAAALSHYNEQVVARRVHTHLDEAEPPLSGIYSFFSSTFESDEEANLGCLLTNTAVESRVLASPARVGVATGLDLIESGFVRVLDRASRAGHLARAASAERLAAQLLALYQGVLVLVRFGTPKAKLADIVENAIPAIISTTQPTVLGASR